MLWAAHVVSLKVALTDRKRACNAAATLALCRAYVFDVCPAVSRRSTSVGNRTVVIINDTCTSLGEVPVVLTSASVDRFRAISEKWMKSGHRPLPKACRRRGMPCRAPSGLDLARQAVSHDSHVTIIPLSLGIMTLGRAENTPLGSDGLMVAVSSSPRPWMDVFALPEKSNMAVTESDPEPKVRKMSITF